MSTKMTSKMAMVLLATVLMCFASVSNATTLDSNNENSVGGILLLYDCSNLLALNIDSLEAEELGFM